MFSLRLEDAGWSSCRSLVYLMVVLLLVERVVASKVAKLGCCTQLTQGLVRGSGGCMAQRPEARCGCQPQGQRRVERRGRPTPHRRSCGGWSMDK